MSALEISVAIADDTDKPFRTAEVSLRAPQDHEIRVRLVATGICHTDVMTKRNGLCQFPIVLGHEGVGIVEAVGENVSSVDVGDHVVLSYDYCGKCPQCSAGKPSYCDDHAARNFAGVRPDGSKTHASASGDVYGSFFQQSSFATHAISHESNTIKVDAELPLPTLAPLGCGVQTGAGTVFNTLKVEPDTAIAIFGCGCVGLSAVMAAKIAGAHDIIAIDIQPDRLRLAEVLGATATVNASNADSANIVARVAAATDRGACHYAVDTSGIPAVLRQAFDVCGPLGITAMVAPNVPGTEVSVEMLGLLPGKSLRGVVQGDSVSHSFIPKLIDLWQQGQFPFDQLITEYPSIDDVDNAVNDMLAGRVIKPVVHLA